METVIYTFSLILCIVASSVALDCYKCAYFSDVSVSVPGYESQEDAFKKGIEAQSNSQCMERNTTSVPTQSCVQGQNPVCTTSDLNIRMFFSMTANDKTISITLSTRARQRACAHEIEGITYKEGCQDAKEYEAMIKDLFKQVAKGSLDLKIDFAGTVCACMDDNCNTALPAQEPPPIGKAITTLTSPLLLVTAFILHKMLA